jgi:hypothetical protein
MGASTGASGGLAMVFKGGLLSAVGWAQPTVS